MNHFLKQWFNNFVKTMSMDHKDAKILRSPHISSKAQKAPRSRACKDSDANEQKLSPLALPLSAWG